MFRKLLKYFLFGLTEGVKFIIWLAAVSVLAEFFLLNDGKGSVRSVIAYVLLCVNVVFIFLWFYVPRYKHYTAGAAVISVLLSWWYLS